MRKWWNQPDQFELMTTILRERNLLRATQMLMALVAAAAGLVPLTILIIAAEMTPAVGVASVGAICFVTMVIGSFLLRWPTRRQSASLAIGGAATIAVWSLAQSDITLRFLACTVMVIVGAYLAVFHNTRLMLLHFGISALPAAAALVQLSHQASIEVVFASFWVLWLLNLAICLGAHGLSRAMTQYAEYARDDPLTGLLNRRGWTERLSQQLAGPSDPSDTHLAVVMVDLDGFKRVNDTRGHADGDRLLIAVADLLRQHCPPHAALCRVGGEEFVVTYVTSNAEAPPVAALLCGAIAALPQSVTASIGTTSMAIAGYSQHNVTSAIDHVMMAADTAMYIAKRNGGNQIHHANSTLGPAGAAPADTAEQL